MKKCLQAHTDSCRPIDPAAARKALLAQNVSYNNHNARVLSLETVLVGASGYHLKICGSESPHLQSKAAADTQGNPGTLWHTHRHCAARRASVMELLLNTLAFNLYPERVLQAFPSASFLPATAHASMGPIQDTPEANVTTLDIWAREYRSHL